MLCHKINIYCTDRILNFYCAMLTADQSVFDGRGLNTTGGCAIPLRLLGRE